MVKTKGPRQQRPSLSRGGQTPRAVAMGVAFEACQHSIVTAVFELNEKQPV